MNVLYFIGNGFDLAQGLKTRYSDFYPYYTNRVTYPSPAVRKICETIKADYATWADMELALGQYTSEMNKENFDDVYYDMSDCLRLYLRVEQEKFDPTESKVKKIKHDILYPHESLLGRDRDSISNLFLQNKDSSVAINIVTLNYTNLLDKIFGEPIDLGKANGHLTNLKGLYHLHGDLDRTIIMGVNDSSQIANQEFAQDDDITDVLIKPQSNDAIRSSESVMCATLIQKADIIVLFGLSLGDSDNFWWQRIATAMSVRSNMRLMIFCYPDAPIDITRGHKIGSKIRQVRNLFLSKIDAVNSVKENIAERIYVSFDQDYLSTINL